MTEPTLSTRIRAVQEELAAINNELTVILDDAILIGLDPFHILRIQAVIDNNHHARGQLNQVAPAPELTAADHQL